MYLPRHFDERRLDVQHALIRSHPFGALVTVGPDGLEASHVPFVLDAEASPRGTLRAHLARANGQWKTFDATGQALVIFQGVETYITPSWYPTKQEGGKVVPTWNYAVVHAYGRARAIHDPDWLLRNVSELSAQNEAGRAEPWSVSDAPPDFVAGLLKAIVGVEIEIERIEGKWKVSQNRGQADRDGVRAGLLRQGDERSAAMAELVAAYGPPDHRP